MTTDKIVRDARLILIRFENVKLRTPHVIRKDLGMLWMALSAIGLCGVFFVYQSRSTDDAAAAQVRPGAVSGTGSSSSAGIRKTPRVNALRDKHHDQHDGRQRDDRREQRRAARSGSIPISSSVARIGLPNPAVAAELFSRSSDVDAWMTPAVPPAPTIAMRVLQPGWQIGQHGSARHDAGEHREGRRQRVEEIVEERDVVRRDLQNHRRPQCERCRCRRQPGERGRQLEASHLARQGSARAAARTR